ncbi:MAG TPA: metallophosphoesterase [Gemmataceae bacterium]|nr:metallophosphoesterase [Gemmataceae bacterium]
MIAPHRLLRICVTALACLFVAFVTPPARAQDPSAKRDWQKQPAIVEIDTTHDIYAVGDPHGDYERLVALLVAAKIMPGDPGPPEKAQWQAGKAVLVCTGDLINKWDQSLRVIALFRALEVEAAKAGGRVVVTMGNHEAEFLVDPTNGKSVEFDKELRGKDIDAKDLAAGTDKTGIGAWLRSLPLAARVNDWFFSHAGNTKGRTLAQLRADLQSGIDKHGFKAPVLLAEDGLLEARLRPEPWWEMPGDMPEQSVKRLTQGIKALGVRHLVMGHQPAKIMFNDGTKRRAGELFQFGDGLVFLIDTGISRGVGFSSGALLHIHVGNKKVRASRIDSTGKSTEIWTAPAAEKSTVSNPSAATKAMHQHIIFHGFHGPIGQAPGAGHLLHANAGNR